MGSLRIWCLASASSFLALVLLHYPLLRLPYFWDEAGYYIPAALDFYRAGLLVPTSTVPVGHTPLVMVYLGLAWRVLGFSPIVTRAAMLFAASATVGSLYVLGRRVAGGEVGAWSAALLAVSPLYFAQSSLAHLDLAAALFTTLAAYFLLEQQAWRFALAASLAILSKETAVALLPIAWVFVGLRSRSQGVRLSGKAVITLTAPLLPLVAWVFYYRHATGYWTGNAQYLEYNLYSTVNPARFFWSLLRRLYEILIGGFNWLPVTGAGLGVWWGSRQRRRGPQELRETPCLERDWVFVAGALTAAYVLMLSAVGGAILPRYLLPILPLFVLLAVGLMWRLPKLAARALGGLTLLAFVGAWFINPPYPFPYEDNLAYADFIKLHQQAADFLRGQAGEQRILTAWPASDELTRPFLGYVDEPRLVVPLRGFALRDFSGVAPGSFDCLYLYSRQWEPRENLLARFPRWARMQARYFDYAPQASEAVLAARYGLKPLAEFRRRGQWVRIYGK